jgi:hypothetical protein
MRRSQDLQEYLNPFIKYTNKEVENDGNIFLNWHFGQQKQCCNIDGTLTYFSLELNIE